MFKYIFLSVLLINVTTALANPCRAAENAVAEGDLIFIDIPYFLFRQVAKGTNSWSSHVGVVFKDEDGSWIVAESALPRSRTVPLCEFINRSYQQRFEVRRFRGGLTPDEVSHMRARASELLNIVYDLGFNFESRKMFCSKFAFLVYQAAGIEVGELQTFPQLLRENPDTSLRFWNFWFLGRIPWDRITITPASQLKDAQFMTVNVY